MYFPISLCLYMKPKFPGVKKRNRPITKKNPTVHMVITAWLMKNFQAERNVKKKQLAINTLVFEVHAEVFDERCKCISWCSRRGRYRKSGCRCHRKYRRQHHPKHLSVGSSGFIHLRPNFAPPAQPKGRQRQ